MDVIRNEWDSADQAKKRPLVDDSGSVSFQFLGSDNLEEIESGIKETIRSVGHSILALGIAFAKIDLNALYTQAGYVGYLEYLQSAEERIGLPTATISDYKRIGETYMQYRYELRDAGFQEANGLHKLRFVQTALKTHEKEDKSVVFKAAAEMNLREFISFARGPQESLTAGNSGPEPVIRVGRETITIDGKQTIQVAPGLPDEERDFVADLLYRSYRIRQGGNTPYVVEVYGPGEQRAIDNFLKKFRGNK